MATSRIFATSTAERLQASLTTAREMTSHGPTIGDEAERAVRQWLTKHLSGAFAVSTGHLVDADDRMSAQTDVVVIRQDIHPRTWDQDSANLFIPEATHAVGEVKAHLGSTELADSVSKARSWRALDLVDLDNVITVVIDSKEPAPTDPVWEALRLPAFLLAFESDLTLATVAERALRPGEERLFDSVFLLDRGCSIQVPPFGPLAKLLGGVPGERLDIDDPSLVMLAFLAWVTTEPRVQVPLPGGAWQRYLRPVFQGFDR